MTSADCPSDQDLRAFHDGTLPPAGLDALADHLETCGRCRDALRRLDGQPDPVLAALRRAPASAVTATAVTAGPAGHGFGSHGLPQLPGYEVLEPLGEGGMGIV